MIDRGEQEFAWVYGPVVDAENVGTWHYDVPSKRLFCSDRAKRDLGAHDVSAITLDALEKAIGSKDWPLLRQAVWQSTSLKHLDVPNELRVRFVGITDGVARLLRLRWATTVDELGLICSIGGTTRDLSHEQHVAEAARLPDDQLRRLGDNIPNGAIYQITTPPIGNSWFSYVSAGIERIFGISPADVRADAGVLYRLIHEEDKEQLFLAEAHAKSKLSSYECEFRQFTRDGDLRTVLCRAAPTLLSDGTMVWDGVVLDVTEQRRVRDLLRTSEEKLRLLADTMPQIVWSAGPTGLVSYLNERWHEYMGTVREEMPLDKELELYWREYLHPDDYEVTRTRWHESLISGCTFSAEHRLRRGSDGAYRWFISRAQPLKDQAGRILWWCGSHTDIHDQRMIREDLARAKARAENESQLKDEFLATLSHELRTPLNSILGWTQLMRKKRLKGEDVLKGMDVIERGARAQVAMIEDLLDMSRVYSGKLRLQIQRIDLAAVLQSAITSVYPSAELKGISLVKEIDQFSPRIFGDPSRLQQVAWNLLTNAVKFTPKGGVVTVIYTHTGEYVELVVIDSGIGIKQDFLPFVFDRFRQADASITRKYAGLGLGLSIVKNIVEMHGGTIEVDSAGEGKGATFTVRLPVRELRLDDHGNPLESVYQLESSGDPDEPALNGLSILIVDDDFDSRQMLKSVLEECGADVYDAGSADEAFSLLEAHPVELLISDIGMPGKDGYSMMKEIRSSKSRFAKVPAIALTAFARPQDRTRSMVAGYHHHLTKPVEPAELFAILQSLVPLITRQQ